MRAGMRIILTRISARRLLNDKLGLAHEIIKKSAELAPPGPDCDRAVLDTVTKLAHEYKRASRRNDSATGVAIQNHTALTGLDNILQCCEVPCEVPSVRLQMRNDLLPRLCTPQASPKELVMAITAETGLPRVIAEHYREFLRAHGG